MSVLETLYKRKGQRGTRDAHQPCACRGDQGRDKGAAACEPARARGMCFTHRRAEQRAAVRCGVSPPSSGERGLTAPPGKTGDRRGPVIRLPLTVWQPPARGPASCAVGGRRVFTVGELPPHTRLTCCCGWCTHVCGHTSSPGGPVTAAWRGTAHRPRARGARTPRRCPGPSRGCFHRDPRKPPSATLPTPCSGPSPTRFPPWKC